MVNWIGLWTLIKREFKRLMMIINQALWPPMISTLLYFFIFGLGLGSRIQTVDGVPYLFFLVPGLVAMNVIDTSYSETSASLFNTRFTNSIQEVLVAPLSYVEMVMGFVVGAMVRALLIGNLLMVIGWLFTGAHPTNWGLYALMIGVVSAGFSGLGLILGLFAETFDQLAIPTTFFITPLVYFGGVFTSIHFLPERVQPFVKVNPLFYLIDGFRASVTGRFEASLGADLAVAIGFAAITLTTAVMLFQRGFKLRT
ncbi:MAG TPA: ABC transporter permease [Stenomitos sp.]